MPVSLNKTGSLVCVNGKQEIKKCNTKEGNDMKKLRKQSYVILITLAATLTSIGIHTLYANDMGVLEQEVTRFDGTLTSVVIEQSQAEVKTCHYPEDASEALCDSFIQRDDKIIQSATAPAGSFEEDGFQPYTYSIAYEQNGTPQNETLILDRLDATAILGFEGKEIQPDTWTELEIIGDYHSVAFFCDDPNVELQDGKVKAGNDVTSFTITASDDGNGTRSGGSVSAEFHVQTRAPLTNSGDAQPEPEPTPEPTYSTNWQAGVYTYLKEYSIDNTKGSFTSDYDNKIKVQGQFVNLKDGVHQLPAGKTPGTLNAAEVDSLFEKAKTITGSGFSYSSDRIWTQTLSLQWPKEEGIFLYRYRIYDTAGGQPIWRENDGSLIIDEEDGWVYEPRIVIGQDFTPPEVMIYAKRAGDSEFHLLLEEESLETGDQLKLIAQDDLSGITSFQYKLVKDEEEASSVAFVDAGLSGEKMITLDEQFKGGTIYAQAKNGNKNNGMTQVSTHILGAVDYVTIALPSSSDIWTHTETLNFRVNEPKNKTIDYDGALISFDGIEEAPRYFAKTNDNVFTTELPDGEYTIIAKAVKDHNGVKEPIDEHSFFSKQKIDHTATIKLEKLSKQQETQPVKVTATSGPSKIKEIRKTCTNTNNQTFEEIIEVSQGWTTYTYDDVMRYNGTCTYTAMNNAKKESDPERVSVNDLHNSDPVLSITASDSTGKTIKSGERAERYVTLQAVNQNPDFQGSVKVCINDQCEPYRFGKVITVDENANVTFVSELAPVRVYETFEVILNSSISLGEVIIEKEEAYLGDTWYSEEQTIHAKVEGGDEDAYLSYKIDDGSWVKTNKKSEAILISQSIGTSGTHTLSVRSEKETQQSSIKEVVVNIDRVSPKLALSINDQELSIKATVGESGIATLDMVGPDGTMSLLKYVNADGTIKDYIVQHNGTYTISMENGAGVKATNNIAVTGIDEGAFHMVMTSGGEAYDGFWTNKDILLTWTGGYQSTADFDHYECSIDKTNWKACTSPLTITEEGSHTIQLRSMTQDGKEIKTSTSYEAKLDHTPPTNPTIEMKKLHTEELYQFIRAITFGQYFNEAIRVSMNSTDALSKVSIYYQFTDEDGDFIKDPKDPKWNSYTTAIDLDTEGSVKLVAYACDEAGNCSELSSSDGAMIDFHAPTVNGIKEGETKGYIPRVLTYEDSLSGIDDEQSTMFKDNEVIALSQSMILEDPAHYEFAIYDRAENVTTRDFTLLGFPNIEDITGDDSWKDIIDQIEQEYDENKDSLSDDKQKELEEEIQKIKDAFAKQRVDYLIDPDSGARLQGVEGTTFDSDARLSVIRISDTLTEEERAAYEQRIEHGALQEVYEVKLYKGEEERSLTGPAKLSITLMQEADQFLFVDGETAIAIDARFEGQELNARITATGIYLTMKEQQNQTDIVQGGNDMSGNYLNSVNTGDKQKAGVLFALILMSGGMMVQIVRNRRNRKDGTC